ncbi:MAG: hypothetical protein WC525_05290 [Candidatus Thermoplasmatota archaeon]
MQEELDEKEETNEKEIDLGFLLWKLEELFELLPYYRTIMKCEPSGKKGKKNAGS